jgi:hypothetical protein
MRPAVGVGSALLALGGMVVLGQGGGGSPYESVIKEMIVALDTLTGVLGTIKDEPSAKAARPELKKAAGQLDEVRKKAEGLKPPDKAEKDRVARDYKAKLDTSIRKLLAEEARVKGIPGGAEAVNEIYSAGDKKK